MKKLFATLLALCASVAFGATTLPVQLLNPAGSTAGQAPVSTGPTTPPAWGSVTVPVSTGIMGLGTGVATALGTAVTGSGSLVLQGSPTINTPNITGSASGANPAAGIVGQCLNATSGTVTMTTSGTPQNITSLGVTAGDYLVFGGASFFTTGTISGTALGFNTTTGTLPSIPLYGGSGATLNAGAGSNVVAPFQRIATTTSITIFLVGQENFTTGGTAVGYIQACRWH